MNATRDIGAAVPGWHAAQWPPADALTGRYARLEKLSVEAHAAALMRANSVSDAIWDFLPYGPFASTAAYQRWIEKVTAGDDPQIYAVKNLDSGQWEGVAGYLRISPVAGSIEIGHVNFSPALQRTRAATDAMFMMMGRAFDAGYRRCEWKCDARNLASRRAAERLGLSYEGVFRQANVLKGRNRDTAWFAAIDLEWPALKQAFTDWLDPANFDGRGRQRVRLATLTGPIRVADDPTLKR